MRRSISIWATALVVLLFGSTASAQSGPNNLVLEFERLEPLDEAVDGHYEGWAIVSGSPISTGKFNVNASGQPIGLGGGGVIPEFDAGTDIRMATDIKISIEPPGDVDAVPDPHIILGGPVGSGVAGLVLGIPGRSTLETMTTGSFILATPSDNGVEAGNDEMGIWFLKAGPVPGFVDLPALGPNWRYEGWVVDTSGGGPAPYTSGKFDAAAGFDDDQAGCNGGGPPFPGQDYVAFHCGPELTLDDGNFLAVLSIEPHPDPNPAPFMIKPMAAAIPTTALGAENPMNNQASATFPVGVATLFSGTVANEAVSMGELKSRY